MRARLYARVSTEEQSKKGLSIPVQLDTLKNYCTEHDIEIIDTYVDNGISASTIKKRKAFCRMLEELQKDDLVLVTRLDRFSRNVYDANYLLKQFAPLNVQLKTILEDDIDTTTADGKFMFDLKVSLAERERKKTSERIKDVMANKRAKGEWCSGSVPLGYTLKNKHLVPNEKVHVVRELFEWYLDNNSLQKTTKLYNMKYGMKYSPNALKKILTNTIYIGSYPTVEPIIDKSLFDSVQPLLEQANSIGKTGKNHTYIFQGLIYCRCGRKMGARTDYVKLKDGTIASRPCYKCQGKMLYDNCKHFYIAENKLEKLVLEDVLKQENEPFELEEEKKESNLSEIQKALDKEKRLKELYIEGLLDRNSFDTEITKLKPIISQPVEKKETIIRNFKNISEYYQGLDKKQKRVFMHTLIEKIQLDDNRKLVVVYR